MRLAIIWLVILLVCLGVEFATLGLASIWFAGGALLALLVSLTGGPLWLQIAVFVVVSVVLLIFTRPIATRYFNKNREKTNIDSVIGKEAIVSRRIENIQGTGQIITGGIEWTARSYDNSVIEEGAVVIIEKIEGVKAIVKIKKEGD